MPQLKEIMTPDVEVISPDATAAEVASKMKALDVGMIPVCNGNTLVGTITDRDLVLRVMASGAEPKRVPVRDIMTAELHYCFEDEDAEQAAAIMADKQIRRLPILSRSKQLVGIVSLGDLAVEGTDIATSGAVLQQISEQSPTQGTFRKN